MCITLLNQGQIHIPVAKHYADAQNCPCPWPSWKQVYPQGHPLHINTGAPKEEIITIVPASQVGNKHIFPKDRSLKLAHEPTSVGLTLFGNNHLSPTNHNRTVYLNMEAFIVTECMCKAQWAFVEEIEILRKAGRPASAMPWMECNRRTLPQHSPQSASAKGGLTSTPPCVTGGGSSQPQTSQ